MIPLVRLVMHQTRARIFSWRHPRRRQDSQRVRAVDRGHSQGQGRKAQRVRQDDQAARGRKSDHRRLRSLCSATQQFRSFDLHQLQPTKRSWGVFRDWWRLTPGSIPPENEAAAKAMGVKRVCIPNRSKQEHRTQTRAEETLVPQRPEMAYRMRRAHQYGQAAKRSRSLPIQGRRRNAAVGRARRDLRQSCQHRTGDGQTSCPLSSRNHRRALHSPPPTSAGFALLHAVDQRPENIDFKPGDRLEDCYERASW